MTWPKQRTGWEAGAIVGSSTRTVERNKGPETSSPMGSKIKG